MTREETISILEESKRQNEIMRDNPSTFWASHQMAEGVKNAKRRIEAFEIALSALRPVGREQVEKVWIGCNNCRTCDSCAYRYTKAEEEPCWSCNTNIYSNYKPEPNRKFCPACGAPMTDEAVEIRLKELEALYGE